MKKLALILAFLFALSVQAQVPVGLAPVARQQFFGQSGQPLAGGFVYFFNSGTSTPAATYYDGAGLFPQTNPVVLDAGGFATIFLAAQAYKVCVANASNVQQYCVDPVQDFGLIASINAMLLTGNQTAAGNKTFTGTTTFNGPVNINSPLTAPLTIDASLITMGPDPWADAKAFGAKCDSLTDDSIALQNWINFGVANGAILKIPPGSCNFATGLVSTSAVSIQGAVVIGGTQAGPLPPHCAVKACGAPVSTLYYTGLGGTALNINNGTTFVYGVNLSNFNLVGGNVSNSGTGIACTFCNQLTIDSVQVASVSNPGFITAFDFSNSAGVLARNMQESLSVNAVKLVNATNVDIDACGLYSNTTAFLMGGSQGGIWVHNCLNVEAQDYVVNWDDTNPSSASSIAENIHFDNNYFLFDQGNAGGPSFPHQQVLHVSNTGTNVLTIENLGFKGNTMFCPASPSCTSTYAFNVAISASSPNTTVSLTAENNWLFAFASGGITANSPLATVKWIDNMNLTGSGTPNTDTNGTGTFCVVTYTGGTANLCPVTTPSATVSGNITDQGVVNYKRLRANQGSALVTGDFALTGSPSWGAGASVAAVTGQDSSFDVTVTSGSSGVGTNPGFTLTFHDGAWPNSPTCVVSRGDFATPLADQWNVTSQTTTQIVVAFIGTPNASTTYQANVICIGRP
jgi:hypothetical protein